MGIAGDKPRHTVTRPWKTKAPTESLTQVHSTATWQRALTILVVNASSFFDI
jgi:hypothetical protein